MASTEVRAESKVTILEYLLSNNGPYDCLVAILRHLNHEDVLSLRKVSSEAIQQSVVLTKIAKDGRYNGLLQGSCQYPIYKNYKQVGVCGNSPQECYEVRLCQTHNGENFSVCSSHAGPDQQDQYRPPVYNGACSECIVRVSERISDHDYGFCTCIEDFEKARKLWSCKLCWRYSFLRPKRIGSGKRCDICFPTLDDFQSHCIISTDPKVSDCLSTLDQSRCVSLDRACLESHKQSEPHCNTLAYCQGCYKFIGNPFVFLDAAYITYPGSQMTPMSETEYKAWQLGGFFQWCGICKKLIGDPWAGQPPLSEASVVFADSRKVPIPKSLNEAISSRRQPTAQSSLDICYGALRDYPPCMIRSMNPRSTFIYYAEQFQN